MNKETIIAKITWVIVEEWISKGKTSTSGLAEAIYHALEYDLKGNVTVCEVMNDLHELRTGKQPSTPEVTLHGNKVVTNWNDVVNVRLPPGTYTTYSTKEPQKQGLRNTNSGVKTFCQLCNGVGNHSTSEHINAEKLVPVKPIEPQSDPLDELKKLDKIRELQKKEQP